jgi:alpha-methylacyl-CoA racemase
MLLADFGADVVRIDKPNPMPSADVLCRRKRSLQLDLKEPYSKAVLERLLAEADVLIDPFRPGVLESLDLDPRRLMRVNEKLIVAQLTGFRKDGNMIMRIDLILGKYRDMAGMNNRDVY